MKPIKAIMDNLNKTSSYKNLSCQVVLADLDILDYKKVKNHMNSLKILEFSHAHTLICKKELLKQFLSTIHQH